MNGSDWLDGSRWSIRTGRIIDALCFVALIAVMATTLYGFALRAPWAQGYYVVIAVTVAGAVTILIGLAQQAIAARDAATWRSMAEWQIRAARNRIAGGAADTGSRSGGDLDPDSPLYYEHLAEALLDTVQREDADR